MADSRAPAADLIGRGRVVLVAFVVACACSAEAWPPTGLAAAFFGAFFVQVWFAAYEGGFSRRRTWSWTGLVLAAVFFHAVYISGYILSWRQVWGWLGTVITRDGGQLSEWLSRFFDFAAGRTGRKLLSILALLLAWIFLLLDLLLSHLDRSGDRNAVPSWPSVLAALFGLCLGWGVGLIWLNATRAVFDPSLSPYHILTDWHFLPSYAVLRCIPDKLGGVVAMLVVMLVPILVPWLASPRYRLRPLKAWFQPACLSLGLTWVVLGWLGTQPPEGDVIWQSRVLTIWYFAFFLIVLPFFAIWARRRAKAEAIGVADTFE